MHHENYVKKYVIMPWHQILLKVCCNFKKYVDRDVKKYRQYMLVVSKISNKFLFTVVFLKKFWHQSDFSTMLPSWVISDYACFKTFCEKQTSLWYLLGVTLRFTPLTWFDKVWKFFCSLKCNCALNIWTKWEFVLFNNCNYVWTMVWVPLFTKKLLWQCVTNWPHISPSLVYNCSQDGHLIRQLQHLKKNINIRNRLLLFWAAATFYHFTPVPAVVFHLDILLATSYKFLINSRLFPALFYILDLYCMNINCLHQGNFLLSLIF